ncbi:ABC transporter ATP-binding protein [Oceanotoga sp. DSM 15011]|uniref:ABC transporter ATP-binding protein n=1 Tax=Oceanotoga sp. DSM 15011 TaxID=2984951 RepID=UPI0021F4978E|nr:ABC transporter ATP-binding protein [Oceanotoga sp. DSM 15011]UYO99367.1 ABC transporter ATP-binding protein [Oceanotoga sp. DSM 15011]
MIIKTENLKTCYDKYIVFEDLNISIESGTVTTIIGPNGCGKSTLLKTIGRILKQDSGKVFLENENMRKMQSKKISKKIALLPQNPKAPGQLKVRELISYGRYPHRNKFSTMNKKDLDMINWAMEVTNIKDFQYRNIDSLSGGQRQKVWLAMALAQETKILLLDEPTTYLDMAHQLDVLKIVDRLNKDHERTIVMVLHDINHASKFSTNIIAMKDGEIVKSGTPKEVINHENLKRIFNIDSNIIIDQKTDKPLCIDYDMF